MTAAAHPPHASILRIARFATRLKPRPGTLAPAIVCDFTTKESRRKHRGRIQHDSPRKYGSARISPSNNRAKSVAVRRQLRRAGTPPPSITGSTTCTTFSDTLNLGLRLDSRHANATVKFCGRVCDRMTAEKLICRRVTCCADALAVPAAPQPDRANICESRKSLYYFRVSTVLRSTANPSRRLFAHLGRLDRKKNAFMVSYAVHR